MRHLSLSYSTKVTIFQAILQDILHSYPTGACGSTRKLGLKNRTFPSRKSAIIWRRRWDSNPRDVLPSTRFLVELVMTTSILLHFAPVLQALNYFTICCAETQGFFHFPSGFLFYQEGVRQIAALRILGKCGRAGDFPSVVHHNR